MRRNLPRLALLAHVVTATPLWADPPPVMGPMSQSPGIPLMPSEFSAYAVGRTLSYAANGVIWGQEQYLADNRVIWAFTGQDCQRGQWFPQGNAVCFVYDGDEAPKCWNFYMGPRGLIAKLIGDSESTPLSEVGSSNQTLVCQGPQVGA